MDTITHGIQGSIIYLVLATFLFALFGITEHWLIYVLFLWGAIEGMLPDIYPWYRYKFKGDDRWGGFYHLYHFNVKSTIWKYFPAFRLHVSIIDPPFHAEDGAWWPRMWKMCAIYWILNLIFLWIIFVL